jgi:hypothetical protein
MNSRPVAEYKAQHGADIILLRELQRLDRRLSGCQLRCAPEALRERDSGPATFVFSGCSRPTAYTSSTKNPAAAFSKKRKGKDNKPPEDDGDGGRCSGVRHSHTMQQSVGKRDCHCHVMVKE